MELFEAIGKRHSIRGFLPRAVEGEKLEKILESANQAPSSGNNQGYEIVVLEEPLQIDDLFQALVEQTFEKPPQLVLVFCANEQRSSSSFGARGKSLYCIQDATIAGAYAQLAAQGLGLATVWVGAFKEEVVRKVIEGPDFIRPVGLLLVGYPDAKPTPTTRRHLSEIVHREKF